MKEKKRILELDLAKGVAVFLIPMAHSLLIYGTPETQSSEWLGLIVHFFGKWAGIFLIAMGFSFTLSKKNTVLASIKRGFVLLSAGYFMNFLKFIVPYFLGLLPTNFIEAYGWSSPLTLENMVYMVLTGDILQLAGMCLMFMGVLQKMSKHFGIGVPLISTVVILVLLEFVRGFRLGNQGVDYVLDLLWGDQWNVYFAVFPWFGFVLIGMFFGNLFQQKKFAMHKISKQMGYAGCIALVIGGTLCFYDYDFHMRDYFHLGIGGFIYLLGFNLLAFWLAHFLLKKYKENQVFHFFYNCSKKITSIYIVQWVLICFGMGLFGFHSQTTSSVFLLMVLFTVFTFAIQKMLDAISIVKKSKLPKNRMVES